MADIAAEYPVPPLCDVETGLKVIPLIIHRSPFNGEIVKVRPGRYFPSWTSFSDSIYVNSSIGLEVEGLRSKV